MRAAPIFGFVGPTPLASLTTRLSVTGDSKERIANVEKVGTPEPIASFGDASFPAEFV
jgi:hypothetical protein